MKMIDETIVGYMQGNKRLVIPALGAFLRKDGDGKVIFVEFLKKDDGVLAGELTRAYGLSAAEAAESVAEFIAALRRGASSPAGYLIAGLGTMRTDVNGVYDLAYDPAAGAATTALQPEPASRPEQTPEPQAEPASRPVVAPAVRSRESEATQSSAPAVAGDTGRRESAWPDAVTPAPQPEPPRRPAVALGVAEKPSSAGRDERAVIHKTPEPVKVEKGPANLSEQFGSRGDEPHKGMRYQKPAAKAPDYRKKRADMVMVVAIIAATIAIVVMIYGMMNENAPELELHPATEQAAPQQ